VLRAAICLFTVVVCALADLRAETDTVHDAMALDVTIRATGFHLPLTATPISSSNGRFMWVPAVTGKAVPFESNSGAIHEFEPLHGFRISGSYQNPSRGASLQVRFTLGEMWNNPITARINWSPSIHGLPPTISLSAPSSIDNSKFSIYTSSPGNPVTILIRATEARPFKSHKWNWTPIQISGAKTGRSAKPMFPVSALWRGVHSRSIQEAMTPKEKKKYIPETQVAYFRDEHSTPRGFVTPQYEDELPRPVSPFHNYVRHPQPPQVFRRTFVSGDTQKSVIVKKKTL